MASTTAVPVEPANVKPSFAKVAASAYKPQQLKEHVPNALPANTALQPTVPVQSANRPQPNNGDVAKARVENSEEREPKVKSSNTTTRAEQLANSSQQAAFEAGSKEEESEKKHPSITLVKSTTEDSATQLSSSDGSGKPPSLDGKSVASTTTFALDEKDSVKPEDSASLRAVEEEDIISPPDSIATGSRVGSDGGAARAFSDQLHEIAINRPGAPPGRFPNANVTSIHTLYDPTTNTVGRSIPQQLVNGVSSVSGPPQISAIPDEKLIEALESPRDRLFVLKLEQDFIDFVNNSEPDLSLPNCNTFYRMLAHRLADYYLLGHVVDSTMTGVKITKTPPPPLSGLPVSSKNANTPPVDLPARKIMRRGGDGKSGTNTTSNSEGPSKTTSEAGGSGSDGGNDGNDKDKSNMTREQREARYREARQRIFGNAENEETETNEVVGSSEEKDVSRSSSASGKKKSKKQRNYDDDGFEARSRYNPVFPQQYPVPSYGPDNGVYYPGYSGQMHNPGFAGANQSVSPPPAYGSGYPVMMPQESQTQYGWTGQPYQQTNGPIYPAYGNVQNGYDLSADFQRGMQSFQTAPLPSQVTPKMAPAPMASYQETYQPQPMHMNHGWQQMNQQPPYPMTQPMYAQNGPNNRPMSAPVQGPAAGPYPYGQFPASAYNGGKPGRNQHPLPGSFNRQQFNPQSQAFIPGGRNGPFPMQPNMPQMPNQGMNGFGNYQMPAPNQIPNQMSGPSPPLARPQTFGSPRSVHNSIPVPTKPSNPSVSLGPQIASSQMANNTSTSSQANNASVPPQSSIAKWGTPSHLPPKPPPPVQAQPPKFSLPGYNVSPATRPLNAMTPGYAASPPMLRGGAGPSISNPNTAS
ncbi:hypothetical protein BCR34DRAFT_603206 [Clohesyomyces aquaticus]|uniref:SUZ domain-containing protein n=1 Tax=Clohesyomyces aquaticus TaxID=1231657 RepID=A0A1Y1ZF70_9PLEO|nr:hypothetical protein BCR34DRAFT_603206 [Clohesyomyces aquaticus]